MRFALLRGIVVSILCATPVLASETINYTYDVHGRLVQVNRSGTVNNGAQTVYQHDNADNRMRVTITNAHSRVVVVPINGLTVIPIPDP